jgi:hypothetical protein
MRKKGKSLKEVTDDCYLVKHCLKRSLNEIDFVNEKRVEKNYDFEEQMDKRKSSVYNW